MARWMLPNPEVGNPSPTSSFELVYLSDYLTVPNQDQIKLIDSFVADACPALNAKVTKFNLRERGKVNHPPGTSDDVDEYLKDVITQAFYYSFYHSTDDFREKYADLHDGVPPYVIPFVQQRWEKGRLVSVEQNKESSEKLDVYQNWLLKTLSPTQGEITSLVILPVANVTPNYWDEPSPSPTNQSALDELFVPPILGSPDIVIPVGDIPFESKITRRTEYLPVVVDVVGAPGSDMDLIDTICRVLTASNRPISVLAGRRMFVDG